MIHGSSMLSNEILQKGYE